MRSPSLRKKRLVMAVWLAAFLFVAANHYLQWGILGQADRSAFAIVMFVGLLGWLGYGPRLEEEIRAEVAAKRAEEEAAERVRDKSHDAAETERLRQALGMPPDEK